MLRGAWREILTGLKCTGLVGVLPRAHGAFSDAVVNAMIAQQNKPSVVQLALTVQVLVERESPMFAKFTLPDLVLPTRVASAHVVQVISRSEYNDTPDFSRY